MGLTGGPAPDTVADGVRDDMDLCPATPGGTLVNLDGCPDEDQDQVTDADDECLGTPAFTSVTLIGCPLDPNLANNVFTKTLVKADAELPETGANLGLMSTAGMGFLLGGVGLLGFSRRRRIRTARV